MTVPKRPDTVDLRFNFHQDENYRMVPCNGVWGGVTPHSDIRIDFFVDSWPLPQSVTHGVDPSSRTKVSETRLPAQDSKLRVVERRILFGIMVSAEIAESIGTFLLDKAKEKKAIDVQRRERTDPDEQ